MTVLQDKKHPQPFCVGLGSEAIFIPTYYDTTIGKDIVLWDDILSVFKNADQIRSGPYAILFVKGNDFRNLIPLRIEADQETTFEVIMKDMDKINDQAAIDYTHTIEGIAVNTNPSDEFVEFDSMEMDISSVSTSSHSVEIVSDPCSPSIHTTTGGTKNENKSLDDDNKKQLRVEDTDFMRHYEAGLEHENGDMVPQDYNKAFEHYLKSAEAGYSKAQYKIGRLYFVGNGVTQDYSKAMEWLVRAANQGDADAQRGIGYLYDSGN
ncbi:hypothetical protein BGZ76_001868, partial [Entomortierella beljakovae]